MPLEHVGADVLGEVDHASPPGIGKVERFRDCAGLSGRCAEVLTLEALGQ